MSKFICIDNKIKDRGLFDSPSVYFRRKFVVEKNNNKYILKVCGLGLGVYYINGKIVTKDVLITPTSDYRKTLWYTEYDVTNLIKNGNNIFLPSLAMAFITKILKVAGLFIK